MAETKTQPEGYTNGNPEDSEAIEARVRDRVAAEIPSQTFEQVQEEIHQWVAENIDVLVEPVPADVDKKRDEVYFSDPIPRNHKTNDGVKFLLDGDWTGTILVTSRMKGMLRPYGLSTDVVTCEYNNLSDKTVVEITVPFIKMSERDEEIEKRVRREVSEIREYRDVKESCITSRCGEDGCDGMVYKKGMGSVGPKYECTRKACGFSFERDVL